MARRFGDTGETERPERLLAGGVQIVDSARPGSAARERGIRVRIGLGVGAPGGKPAAAHDPLPNDAPMQDVSPLADDLFLADNVSLADEAWRLLDALSGEGHVARPALRPGVLVVSGRRDGVTLALCHVPFAASTALIAQGLVTMRGAGETMRLTLSPSGRARLDDRFGVPRSRAGLETDLLPGNAEGGPRRVLMDRRESPLAWLARRRGPDGAPLIDPALFAAGERLRAEFERARLGPRVTMDWRGFGAGGGGAGRPGVVPLIGLAARRRFSRALSAVGPEGAGLLVDVCCFLKGLETVERERGWRPRTARAALIGALGRLAGHYGLEAEARGPARARAILVWRGGVSSE